MMRLGKKTLVAAVAALSASAGAVGVAHGETIYDFQIVGDADKQMGQRGYNYLYLGDDVTAVAPANHYYQLDTVTMQFGLMNLEGGPYTAGRPVTAFTPTIQMDIYEIDPSTRTPTTGVSVGTAVVSNVTFQPILVPDDPNAPGSFPEGPFFASSDLQDVTFDFTSGDVQLPTHFAFVYRVTDGTSADGEATDEHNFFLSIASTQDAIPLAGSTSDGLLGWYGSAAGPVFNGQPEANQEGPWAAITLERNLLASVTATAVEIPIPEPASMSLLALGGLAMLKRRRTA